MADPVRKRELGRGERVVPGVWRLRLPLPWPGVPHCNAWAVAAGDGVVLFDTGMHEPGSLANLERALGMVNLRLEHVRLVVCTHAHSDHYGQAATILERAGCELWMHPNHEHMTRTAADPDAALQRRLEVARTSGVPEEPLRAYAEARKGQGYGIAGIVEPDRDLLPGVVVDTDLGPWEVHETPGHAPSHVCLHQPERRLLISGDHLLGACQPLLRLRLHALTPPASSCTRWTSSRPSTRGCASPATAGRSPTSRPTSRPTARSWPSACSVSWRS